jgi:hypothetical protein
VIVSGFKPLTGVQCESTMCRNLLASEGLELSEAMVFGLGSGIGFTYMDRSDRKTGLREPMVFCTAKPGETAKNLAETLGLGLVQEDTVSRAEAKSNLLRRLDGGKPYGLKLDRFYLDYMERKAHFSAHYLTACGYDESNLYVVDIGSQEIRKPTFQSIEQARSAKGFMASKNQGLYYEWRILSAFEGALRKALSRTVTEMLYAAPTLSGIKGMEKFAERVGEWWKNPNFRYQLVAHYVTWEGEGDAGGGFRRLFASFLEEAAIVLNNRELRSAGECFQKIAESWSETDEIFRELCLEQDGLHSRLAEAAKAIKKQAKLEAEGYRKIERAITC